MNENQNESELEKPNKVVYLDQSRYANEKDLEDINLRKGRASRILNNKGYYKMGNIYAIRNF